MGVTIPLLVGVMAAAEAILLLIVSMPASRPIRAAVNGIAVKVIQPLLFSVPLALVLLLGKRACPSGNRHWGSHWNHAWSSLNFRGSPMGGDRACSPRCFSCLWPCLYCCVRAPSLLRFPRIFLAMISMMCWDGLGRSAFRRVAVVFPPPLLAELHHFKNHLIARPLSTEPACVLTLPLFIAASFTGALHATL